MSSFSGLLRHACTVQDEDGFDEILGMFKAFTPGSHKYLRRVPTGNPKRPFRYYYTVSSIGRGVEHGEEIRLGDKTVKVHEANAHGLTIEHDDGHKQTLSHDEWHDLMHEHHGEAYTAAVDKRARQWANAVYRHVPREILADLKGTTDQERLADLRERAPEVYAKLEGAFKRAGVGPDAAKGMVAWVLQRRGWSPDARATLLGAATDLAHGAMVVRGYREIADRATKAAAGRPVESAHVAEALESKGAKHTAGTEARAGKPQGVAEATPTAGADAGAPAKEPAAEAKPSKEQFYEQGTPSKEGGGFAIPPKPASMTAAVKQATQASAPDGAPETKVEIPRTNGDVAGMSRNYKVSAVIPSAAESAANQAAADARAPASMTAAIKGATQAPTAEPDSVAQIVAARGGKDTGKSNVRGALMRAKSPEEFRALAEAFGATIVKESLYGYTEGPDKPAFHIRYRDGSEASMVALPNAALPGSKQRPAGAGSETYRDVPIKGAPASMTAAVKEATAKPTEPEHKIEKQPNGWAVTSRKELRGVYFRSEASARTAAALPHAEAATLAYNQTHNRTDGKPLAQDEANETTIRAKLTQGHPLTEKEKAFVAAAPRGMQSAERTAAARKVTAAVKEATEVHAKDFGEPYGGKGPHFRTPDGKELTMRRKGQKVRFFDQDGKQVGPEQMNVVPATAAAHAAGWLDLGLAEHGVTAAMTQAQAAANTPAPTPQPGKKPVDTTALTSEERNAETKAKHGYTTHNARYSKGNLLVRTVKDGSGFKTSADYALDKVNGRFTGREGGHVLSPSQHKRFEAEMEARAAARAAQKQAPTVDEDSPVDADGISLKHSPEERAAIKTQMGANPAAAPRDTLVAKSHPGIDHEAVKAADAAATERRLGHARAGTVPGDDIHDQHAAALKAAGMSGVQARDHAQEHEVNTRIQVAREADKALQAKRAVERQETLKTATDTITGYLRSGQLSAQMATVRLTDALVTSGVPRVDAQKQAAEHVKAKEITKESVAADARAALAAKGEPKATAEKPADASAQAAKKIDADKVKRADELATQEHQRQAQVPQNRRDKGRTEHNHAAMLQNAGMSYSDGLEYARAHTAKVNAAEPERFGKVLQEHAKARLTAHVAEHGDSPKSYAKGQRAHLESLAKGEPSETAQSRHIEVLQSQALHDATGVAASFRRSLHEGAVASDQRRWHAGEMRRYSDKLAAVEGAAGDKPTQEHVEAAVSIARDAKDRHESHSRVHKDDDAAYVAHKDIETRSRVLQDKAAQHHQVRTEALDAKLRELGKRGTKGQVNYAQMGGKKGEMVLTPKDAHVHKGLGIIKEVSEPNAKGKTETTYNVTHHGTGLRVATTKTKAEAEHARGAMLATGVDWEKHKTSVEVMGDANAGHLRHIARTNGAAAGLPEETLAHLEQNIDRHLGGGGAEPPKGGSKAKAAQAEPAAAPEAAPAAPAGKPTAEDRRALAGVYGRDLPDRTKVLVEAKARAIDPSAHADAAVDVVRNWLEGKAPDHHITSRQPPSITEGNALSRADADHHTAKAAHMRAVYHHGAASQEAQGAQVAFDKAADARVSARTAARLAGRDGDTTTPDAPAAARPLADRLTDIGKQGQKASYTIAASGIYDREPKTVEGTVLGGIGVHKDGKAYAIAHLGTGGYLGGAATLAEAHRIRGGLLASGVEWDKHKTLDSIKADPHIRHASEVLRARGTGNVMTDATTAHLEAGAAKHESEPAPSKSGGKAKANPAADARADLSARTEAPAPAAQATEPTWSKMPEGTPDEMLAKSREARNHARKTSSAALAAGSAPGGDRRTESEIEAHRSAQRTALDHAKRLEDATLEHLGKASDGDLQALPTHVLMHAQDVARAKASAGDVYDRLTKERKRRDTDGEASLQARESAAATKEAEHTAAAKQLLREKGIPAHAVDRMAGAIANVVMTGEDDQGALDPSNKHSRATYEALTGTKLPSGVKATKEHIRATHAGEAPRAPEPKPVKAAPAPDPKQEHARGLLTAHQERHGDKPDNMHEQAERKALVARAAGKPDHLAERLHRDHLIEGGLPPDVAAGHAVRSTQRFKGGFEAAQDRAKLLGL